MWFYLISFIEFCKTAFFVLGYISNNSLFPEPLSQEEEKKYLERYMNGDEEARNVLIERNLRLVAHICKKYNIPNLELDDLISIGTLGAKKYHPWVGLMLLWYHGLDFCDDYAEIASTRILTRMARLHYSIRPDGKYLELPNNVKIFPREWFCPDKIDNKWQITNDTCVIHHFSGLW